MNDAEIAAAKQAALDAAKTGEQNNWKPVDPDRAEWPDLREPGQSFIGIFTAVADYTKKDGTVITAVYMRSLDGQLAMIKGYGGLLSRLDNVKKGELIKIEADGSQDGKDKDGKPITFFAFRVYKK